MAAKKPSLKARAWCGFDRITADAAPHGEYSNPWYREDGRLRYRPDFETLRRLLAVPLFLGAGSTSGVPALALDVWVSYELRRAGFAPDVTWPRATPYRPHVTPTTGSTPIGHEPIGVLRANAAGRLLDEKAVALSAPGPQPTWASASA